MHKEFQRAAEQVKAVFADTQRTSANLEALAQFAAQQAKVIAEDSCYWERDKDDSGEFDSIIANDNVSDGARASVTVKKGEFFQSEGCGIWKLT